MPIIVSSMPLPVAKGSKASDACCVIADDVFSEETCTRIMRLIETRGYERALLNTTLRNDFRQSDRCMIDSAEATELLWSRVKDFIPPEHRLIRDKGLWRAVGLNDRLRFLRYEAFFLHFLAFAIFPVSQNIPGT